MSNKPFNAKEWTHSVYSAGTVIGFPCRVHPDSLAEAQRFIHCREWIADESVPVGQIVVSSCETQIEAHVQGEQP